MRNTISLALVVLILIQLPSAAFGAESLASQITAMPIGSNIEVRLKSKQKIRGTRGTVSDSGFTLVDANAAGHQIVFDDVISVKQLTKKSHLTRNVLIGVGVGAAALAITAAILFRCGALGCGSKF